MQRFSEKFYLKRISKLVLEKHYNILQNINFAYRFIAKTIRGQYKIL